jgi:hypothetical protein
VKNIHAKEYKSAFAGELSKRPEKKRKEFVDPLSMEHTTKTPSLCSKREERPKQNKKKRNRESKAKSSVLGQRQKESAERKRRKWRSQVKYNNRLPSVLV